MDGENDSIMGEVSANQGRGDGHLGEFVVTSFNIEAYTIILHIEVTHN